MRGNHRTALTVHFFVLVAVLAAAFLGNRHLTPHTFWAQWVALAAGVAFAVHLVVFARGTLATMAPRRPDAPMDPDDR